jgi:MFS transporter, PPP family, 3-phenylpropionic acid transporter
MLSLPPNSPSGSIIAVRVSFFYIAIFAVVGVQLPFWPVFLASRGVDAAEIGLLLAVPLIVKLVANPVAGIIADRLGSRRVLMAGLAAAAFGALSLFALARGFWPLVAVTLLGAAVFSPLIPLGENLAFRVAHERRLDYGRLRLWGSLAFIAAVLAAGEVIGRGGVDWALWLILLFAFLTFASCILLPETTAAATRAAPWRLLGNRPLLLVLLAATLVQASHSAYYVAGTLYWRTLGHSSATIAWLWAEGVVAEIVLFWFGAGLVQRLGPLGLLMLGGLAGLARWSGTALAESIGALVLLQAMHGLTFGAVHLGVMHFLQRSVPPALSATGQALYSTMTGIGFGVGMAGAGALYQRGAWLAWAAMAAMATAGALLALRLTSAKTVIAAGAGPMQGSAP